MCPLGMAISLVILPCHSKRRFCHREERSDLAFPEQANREKRNCFAGSPLCVIARDEAISPFRSRQTEKREIASQARLYVSSRGTWRSRLSGAGKQRKERLLRRLASMCHREERGDLAFPEQANREKRDCFTGSPLSVIARNEAISPFDCQQTDKREIASQARNDSNIVSSRAQRGDLSFQRWPTPKERLLRRLAMTKLSCHREERSDLAFPEQANREKRDCFAGSQ